MAESKEDKKESGKESRQDLEKKRIEKDLKTLEEFETNDHIKVTIEKTKFRGTQLNQTIRIKKKNKKGEGRVVLKTVPWKKGEDIVQSISQVKGWIYHGLVHSPKKVRKEKSA